jgi:type IV pilus assembly protein PilM
MPPIPTHELASAVRLAVKNFIPFPLDEAVLDFRLTNKFSHQGKERHSILVAACPVKVIERIQNYFLIKKISPSFNQHRGVSSVEQEFRGRGIKVASCVPGAIALENFVRRTQAKDNETLAIVVLKSAVTELTIYRDSHLELFRRLSVTGDDITKSMTGVLISDTGKTELTFAEAEAIKKEFGIPPSDGSFSMSEKITSDQVLLLIKPKLEQLATDISRSFDYFQQELQGGKVAKVLLVGGAAQLKRLDEFLSVELGLEVKRGNPLEGVALIDPSLIHSGDSAQKQVLAIGAALGQVSGINFLSKGLKKNQKPKAEISSLKTLVVLIITGFILVFVLLSYQIKIKNEQINFKNQKLVSLLKEARGFLDIRQLKDNRPSWGEILNIFSGIPSDIHLTELILEKDQLRIQGLIWVTGDESKEILADFIAGLKKSILENPRLKFFKKIKDETNSFEFEIVANIDSGKQ